MIKTFLKLALLAAFANASWHLFVVYSAHYKFKDGVTYTAHYRGEMTDDQVRGVMDQLARMFRDAAPTSADEAASFESASFVMATVSAPCLAPSSITAITSGEEPDCDMPMTHWPSNLGGLE